MRFERRFSVGLLALALEILVPTLGAAQLFDLREEYYQANPLLGGTVQANDLFGFALAAGDFNGDGKDDLAVGQPVEPADALGGHVYVLYAWLVGSPTTASGFHAAQEWRQGPGSAGDTANVGNWFGSALAAGDFDGDGIQDLAIGAHTDTVLGVASAGLVHVLYGSAPFGLSTSRLQVWNQTDASPGIEPLEEGDYFGGTLAVGDFNGDGKDDLVISAWGEDYTGAVNAGQVHVLYGTASGLSTAGRQLWRQGSGGLIGATEDFDFFGSTLAAGDFNGDGYDELALGVGAEGLDALSDAGVVQVIHGSPGGLVVTGNEVWTQETVGVGELVETGDEFGSALAAGDFDGDGRDDLAIGSPGEDFENTGVTEAGKLFVLKGSASGLSTTGAQQWFELFSGGDGVSSGDRYAHHLAAADFDGNGSADLAIGMPWEDLELPGGEIRLSTGQVLVLYSTVGFGLDVSRLKQRFTEITGGLGGQSLAQDQYGSALAAGDFDGDGVPSLAISTPWEDLFGFDWAGVVHVLEDGLLFKNGFDAGNLSGWTSGGPCPSCL